MRPAYCTHNDVASCTECDLASDGLDCKGMLAIDVAGNVRKARKAAGLTQKELSIMSQVPVKQIALIESGFQDVSMTHLLKLALSLGISGGDLLT